MLFVCFFFLFKQKTAYEMRISDWSSDVCSSDLTDDSEVSIFVAGGILEIQPGAVTVLSDTAIRAEDLDEAKALEARKQAEEALRNTKDKADIAVVEAELAMLAAQAAAARKLSQTRRSH